MESLKVCVECSRDSKQAVFNIYATNVCAECQAQRNKKHGPKYRMDKSVTRKDNFKKTMSMVLTGSSPSDIIDAIEENLKALDGSLPVLEESPGRSNIKILKRTVNDARLVSETEELTRADLVYSFKLRNICGYKEEQITEAERRTYEGK